MEISTAHRQAMSSHQLEELLGDCCPNTTQLQQHEQQQQQNQDRKLKPQPEQAMRCPRCDSTNTKFCYYNNYSLTQPRYFCKGCRRYWTQGGSLRNVPVGGGCRKNKRSSSSSSSSKKAVPKDHHQAFPTNSNPLQLLNLPHLSYDPSDLTLQFSRLQNHCNSHDFLLGGNPNPNPNAAGYIPTGTAFLDILRGGFFDSSTTTTTTTTTTSGGFHNLYYGYGGNGNGCNNVEEVESCGVGGEGMMVPFDEQLGSCKGMDHAGESKVMMGLQPWQMSVGGGDGNSIGVESAGRDYWNGVAGSWHGLINSSLM